MVERPGLENLGSRKAHASSNLAFSAYDIWYDICMNDKKIIIGIIVLFLIGFVYSCLKAIK